MLGRLSHRCPGGGPIGSPRPRRSAPFPLREGGGGAQRCWRRSRPPLPSPPLSQCTCGAAPAPRSQRRVPPMLRCRPGGSGAPFPPPRAWLGPRGSSAPRCFSSSPPPPPPRSDGAAAPWVGPRGGGGFAPIGGGGPVRSVGGFQSAAVPRGSGRGEAGGVWVRIRIQGSRFRVRELLSPPPPTTQPSRAVGRAPGVGEGSLGCWRCGL